MCKCIECEKEFKPYEIEIDCHICNGDGYIESDIDEFMRDDFRKCWQCNGKGILNIIEQSFCDENCREEHFEDYDN